ncbi:hypothetical protein KIL84_015844 [Mauremys mutica]|uniref:Uncharacterized protein n=1 Tax=Mauremys mutica TaxID=74926 RepID=A0A9D3WRB6_9SAUR|nr:hypothetical protein KIL84_015844 [Mauremys mutica]
MVALCAVSAAAALRPSESSPFTPMECLSQIRRRKKAQDDMFQEILQAIAASGNEHRAWRITLADNMDKVARCCLGSLMDVGGIRCGHNSIDLHGLFPCLLVHEDTDWLLILLSSITRKYYGYLK